MLRVGSLAFHHLVADNAHGVDVDLLIVAFVCKELQNRGAVVFVCRATKRPFL